MNNKIKYTLGWIILLIIVSSIVYYANFKDSKDASIKGWVETITKKQIDTPITIIEPKKEELEVLTPDKNISMITKVEDLSTETGSAYYTIDYKGVKYKWDLYNKNNYFLIDWNWEFYVEDKLINEKNEEIWKETTKTVFLENLKETDWFKDYSVKNSKEYMKNNLTNEYLIYWIVIKNPNNEAEKILLVEKIYKTELRKNNEHLISNMMDEIVEASSKYTGEELDKKILEIKERYWFKKE